MRILLFENQPLFVEALQGIFQQLDDAASVTLAQDTVELCPEIAYPVPIDSTELPGCEPMPELTPPHLPLFAPNFFINAKA